MTSWQLTVGLEIHVELETKTKMFCGCPNDPFDAAPNANVCPVCYGLPGALPLLNQEAIAMTVRFGQAVGAAIAPETFWARKNYFYPDLPKGYQISQSSRPIVNGGKITIDGTDYHLNHAHLEEDAGKLMHSADKSYSLVNYNRAGVPLLEIVTEPDFHAVASAKRFCQELQRIMRSLSLSSADMEKGQLRCEANISVARAGAPLGVKVEVKNINSFRSVERAINYECQRQIQLLEAGQTVQPETRSWNDAASKTLVMRTKETSADYRYFPEPDLPMVKIDAGVSNEAHQLPEARRQAIEALGAPAKIAAALVDKNLDEKMLALDERAPKLAKDAAHLMLELPAFAALDAADQIRLLEAKQQSGWTKTYLEALLTRVSAGDSLEDVIIGQAGTAEALDLSAVTAQIMGQNPAAVADYHAGKEAAFHFLVGQVMAETKGRANIQHVRDQLKQALIIH